MAYGIGYDIIVDDDNCNAIGNEYVNRAKKFENALDQYNALLEEILDSAVMNGALSDNLKKFKEATKVLKNEANSIAQAAQGCTRQFLTDMNSADSYLF